jgi:hypothetical protein
VAAKDDVSKAGKVAAVAEQHGHGTANISSHADQRKADAAQAAQHSRDMARIEKMHNQVHGPKR